ncbi:unnamed protein product [Angiostrongylus costaricensis]|uniref:F-box domain-containing protein n=1 Tax=Angiostrongylus costaricensis TaxID=334426 RepID=A0A0R3Q044_ANGCS|nr:unnamed protein product [Angiostrongylus costaricensis]
MGRVTGFLGMSNVLQEDYRPDGLNNLESVDVSFSGLLRGHLVERLLSSCDSLVTLKMDGCDLSCVYFTSTWLPNLRELSLVGCQITDFDSLIEWVSMGCVQLLDLSATDITIDHVRTLIDARLMCPPMVIRLVRSIILAVNILDCPFVRVSESSTFGLTTAGSGIDFKLWCPFIAMEPNRNLLDLGAVLRHILMSA